MFPAGCGNDDQSLTAGEVRQGLADIPYQVTLQESREGENGRGEVIVGAAKNQNGIGLGVRDRRGRGSHAQVARRAPRHHRLQ
jgi:hypothetical protein